MPDNSQNFNRFGYCLNNPLIYTDPSGDFIITAVLVGVAIGVGVDYGVQVASNYLSGDRGAAAWFYNIDFFDVAVSGAIGGLTAGYGSAFSNGAKLGKFGMAIVNNSALIRLAEVGLTSAIDITGNGWQDISFKDFGTRAIVAGITFGISSAVMPKAKPQLDNMPRSKEIQVLARGSDKALQVNPIELTTSSKSLAPSRTYTIFDGRGELYKFGVSDANLSRYGQSLGQAGPGAFGKFSSIMPKNKAHIMEKYLRSLQYNSTGQYLLPGMKIPYPVNFNTGLRIKP